MPVRGCKGQAPPLKGAWRTAEGEIVFSREEAIPPHKEEIGSKVKVLVERPRIKIKCPYCWSILEIGASDIKEQENGFRYYLFCPVCDAKITSPKDKEISDGEYTRYEIQASASRNVSV